MLHEISHLRRFDIGVKWLTMLAISIHWFNPLMQVIKKEVNHACELACDEAVIKNLNPAEKQAYGNTLISVVAEHKYSCGVLQATMCEEKKSLKERLIAIMNHQKKSKLIKLLSVVLLVAAIIGAIGLGASVSTVNDHPPVVRVDMLTYNLPEIAKHKTPYIGNASKVAALAGRLPVPDSDFKQQYISMFTSSRPYKLNVFYEVKQNDTNRKEWAIENPNPATKSNLRKNALVLFCMIDNLDEVTFAFRKSQSSGDLDTSKYNTSFTFQRQDLEKQYGDLTQLGKDLDLLQAKLAEEKPKL